MGKQQYIIEIPASVGRRVARRARQENRKPSDLAVEALRRYIALPKFPEETPTPAELRAIRRGEAAIERGDSITLDELRRKETMARRPRLAGPAQKSLERMPPRDQARVRAALDEMELNPFSGDIKYLKGDPRLRRRVGSWRIFFRVERAQSAIYISAIERRSSTTY
jgi:mRNA-degrading endonuclease RelE of RelBE toxin-antitoxin system/predicted transcriptional regulator